MAEYIQAEPDIDSEDLVRVLLEETNTIAPPTNAERLARYLDLSVVGFSHSEYKLDKKIRAFLWPAKKLIGVDRKLTPIRRNYSILHEIGHFVLPGHIIGLSEDDRIVDDDRMLSRSVVQQEIEANQFAADCLFQLEKFTESSKNLDINWDNIKLLADRFNASFESTSRRWVEKSQQECALIVFNPASAETNAPLKVMYTVTSESFKTTYFSKLSAGQEISQETLAHKIFHHIEYQDNPIENLQIVIAGKLVEFPMQLFTNGYRLFGLLTPSL